jgi:DNA-binding transcriptional regulator YdaS (Cro superfamily)
MINEPLKRACDVAGGQKSLADRIRTTQSQVWYWLERSKKGVPAEFVLSIERETGVSRSELRPDLWPAEVKEEART